MIQTVPSLLDFGTTFGVIAIIVLILTDIVVRQIWKKVDKVLKEHSDAVMGIRDLRSAFVTADGKGVISRADLLDKIETVIATQDQVKVDLKRAKDELEKVCSLEKCPALPHLQKTAEQVLKQLDGFIKDAKNSRVETQAEIKAIHSHVTGFTESVGVEMIHVIRELKSNGHGKKDNSVRSQD